MGRGPVDDNPVVFGIKGINQQDRLADPRLELADARNMWAPNGKLEKRPGYFGVGASTGYDSNQNALTGSTVLSEDTRDTFTATGTLSSKAVGKWWYIGWTEAIDAANYPAGINLNVATSNSNEMSAIVEYWNGTGWAGLSVAEIQESTGILISSHLGTSGARDWYFPSPKDWAQTTLGSTTAYFLRFTLQAMNGSSAFDASTSVTTTSAKVLEWGVDDVVQRYLVAASFPTRIRFLRGISANGGLNETKFLNTGALAGPTSEYETYQTSDIFYHAGDELPCVVAIPQYDDGFFVTYNYVTTFHCVNSFSSDARDRVAKLATVEDDPEFVGSGAAYSPDFLPQLATWPAAKYFRYHRGELWAANLKDGGQHTVRWSAPDGFALTGHKVWPTLNIEVLADKDSSPVSALFPFDQDMMVFKSDSMWRMVYTGQNFQQMNTYRGVKTISGTGCVSQNSICDIKGNLFLLAEDGVYRFDGVHAVKLSDRIQKYIDKIVPGRRAHATAVHWKKKSCYLLAVTTTGSAVNNLILVYDYKNDSWWVWDNIEVMGWLNLEDASDNERVYFYDRAGRIYELGVGLHDFGTAITGYYTTQRLNQTNVNQKVRGVTFLSTNLTRSLTVEVQPNDQPFLGQDTVSVSFTDPNEKEYGVAQFDKDHYTPERDRYVGTGELKAGSWFRLKVSHTEKDAPCVISEAQLQLVDTGVRR